MTKAEQLIVVWVAANRAELVERARYERLTLSDDLEARQRAVVSLNSAALETARVEQMVVALAAELAGKVQP